LFPAHQNGDKEQRTAYADSAGNIQCRISDIELGEIFTKEIITTKSEVIFRKSFHSEILKFLPQNAVQNGGGR